MTWLVEATHGAGTWSREFDTVAAARGWEFLMACHGYDTTRPMPVDGGRHLKVITAAGERLSRAQLPRPQKERNSMSDLHSVKAPDETPTEPERKVRTFRVLKFGDDINAWREVGTYETVWTPDAGEVGERYGEGDYLLIEQDDKYSFQSAYGMRVVADRVYRLADDETPA